MRGYLPPSRPHTCAYLTIQGLGSRAESLKISRHLLDSPFVGCCQRLLMHLWDICLFGAQHHSFLACTVARIYVRMWPGSICRTWVLSFDLNGFVPKISWMVKPVSMPRVQDTAAHREA